MRAKSKKSKNTAPNLIISSEKRNLLINKLKRQINGIIMELAKLQNDTDEESLIRISELTQERDRLIERLDLIQETEAFAGEKRPSRVDVGDRVLLKNGKGNLNICLVGDFETDSSRGDISVNSPLGKQLLNRKIGEKFEVKTPRGLLNFEVLEIS